MRATLCMYLKAAVASFVFVCCWAKNSGIRFTMSCTENVLLTNISHIIMSFYIYIGRHRATVEDKITWRAQETLGSPFWGVKNSMDKTRGYPKLLKSRSGVHQICQFDSFIHSFISNVDSAHPCQRSFFKLLCKPLDIAVKLHQIRKKWKWKFCFLMSLWHLYAA